MSFVTENSMKSNFKLLSSRQVTIRGINLDIEVYKTSEGMVFEVVEHVPDTTFDDNYVSRYQTTITWDKIVDAPDEPLQEEDNEPLTEEDNSLGRMYGGVK